jgi:glycosyltransferase involved in cell wall biosynthesis
MRIAYDGSGLTPPQSGVGNYIQQLFTHMLAAYPGDAYALMAHRRRYVERWVNAHENAERLPIHFPNRFLWMQFLLPVALRRWNPHVAHFTNFVAPLAGDGNMVVTVHDVALLQFPEYASPRQRVLMRPLIEPTVRRARRVITVSEQSKREIVKTLRLAPERVQVIYEAAAPAYFQAEDARHDARRRAAYGWEEGSRHLLWVGTLQPRKNLTQLVAALSALHQRGVKPHLWMVGQDGWDSDRIRQRVDELELRSFVHFTGYVPVEDLRAFYRGCDAFVFPSFHEGFGLPVLEAMACGAPIALADTPTLREIAGDAAEYFDPRDVRAQSEAVRRLLDDAARAQTLRERGRARAQEFSWERAARETYEVYCRVASR